MNFSRFSAIGLLIVLFGCAHAEQGRAPDAAANAEAEAPRDETAKAVANVEDTQLPKVDEIDKIIADAAPVLAEMAGGDMPVHIPLEVNRKVAQWIHFFTVKERDMTQRYLERGEALRPHIQHILKENDMPAELYFLAMIESGFVTHARSRARAVGVWQFMKGTGKNYGLTTNQLVDERRNWVKATEAAASYLKDLNNVFGSWYLALAAYNAGEHRIVRSIMNGKTRDFWALAEAKMLPRETLNYVPKFIAAQVIGRSPEKFGFKIEIPNEDKWEEYTTVSVPGGVRLQDLAKATTIPLATLKKWNEDLIRGVVPQEKGGLVDIYVPKDSYALFDTNREAIAKLKPVKNSERVFASAPRENPVPVIDGNSTIYVVKNGDSLFTISKGMGISVRTLMKVNGLRRSRIHPGQRLKVYTKDNKSAAAPQVAKRAHAVELVRRQKRYAKN
jgi:membrane-bound lytic murein transglycosylase D